MKLGTLQTSSGNVVVGVGGTDDAPVFVSLPAIDPSLNGSLIDLLNQDPGLVKARKAFDYGISQAKTVTGKLLAPIQQPGKVICIGLNYRDHAIETGLTPPPEPIVFGKFSSSVIGPQDQIRLPKVSNEVDFEAELVAVIGKTTYQVSPEEALNHVVGYCNGNDISARDLQKNKPGKQWLLGKTPDTFAPIGPWIVTSDEVDLGNLKVVMRLNGQIMQDGNTSDLIFGVAEIVSYLSQVMTLEAGDIIFTGTPAGVGMARTPPVWLKAGDNLEVEIQGLGELKNSVIA